MLYTSFLLLVIELVSSEAITQNESSGLGWSGWLILFILFVLSNIAIFIFFERLVIIKKALKKEDHFLNSIKDFLHDGKRSSAIDLCKKTNSPIARMLEKGIMRIDKPLKDVSIAINNVAKIELAKLENNLSTMATIASVAPMIGFFGTVVGMMMAFQEMNARGLTAETINHLSGGMYTAMSTTLAGLFVGIIAYIGYNYLVSKISKTINKIETVSVDFLDLIHDKRFN